MTIRIIEEPEIVLTRAEYASLQGEWQRSQALCSFEMWLRQRQANIEQVARMRSIELASFSIYPY